MSEQSSTYRQSNRVQQPERRRNKDPLNYRHFREVITCLDLEKSQWVTRHHIFNVSDWELCSPGGKCSCLMLRTSPWTFPKIDTISHKIISPTATMRQMSLGHFEFIVFFTSEPHRKAPGACTQSRSRKHFFRLTREWTATMQKVSCPGSVLNYSGLQQTLNKDRDMRQGSGQCRDTDGMMEKELGAASTSTPLNLFFWDPGTGPPRLPISALLTPSKLPHSPHPFQKLSNHRDKPFKR